MKYRKRRFLLLKRKHIKIIIILSAVLLAAAVIFAVAASSRVRSEKQHAIDSIAHKGVVRIGLRGDMGVLCTFNEETRVFEGLEKDVADEIVRRLFPDDILVDYVWVNSETKDALLRMGEIDMALGASVSVKKSGIAFSAPFFADASALLVKEGGIRSSAQLNGKTVGIVQGSLVAQESEESENLTLLQERLLAQGVDVQVKKYASYPEAINGLRNGTVDAVSASEINLKLFGIKGMLVLPDRFLPSRYCVQFSSRNSALGDVLSDIIAQMRKDGTMDTLAAKWNLVDYSVLE